VVNYFGLRAKPRSPIPVGVDVIEDHSHDPWSKWASDSEADFCVASLRKTLPLPDGGVLWSPRSHPVPVSVGVSEDLRRASSDRLAGMILKNLYLHGHSVPKETFRRLGRRGEANLSKGSVSGMSEVAKSLLEILPTKTWRDLRRENYAHLRRHLDQVRWATMLLPSKQSCPFCMAIICDTEARCAHLKRALQCRNVYGAVLWPLERTIVDGVPLRDRKLSRRLICLHCDMRYSAADMSRVGSLVLEVGEGWVGHQGTFS
jgi:hypothetical protein